MFSPHLPRLLHHTRSRDTSPSQSFLPSRVGSQRECTSRHPSPTPCTVLIVLSHSMGSWNPDLRVEGTHRTPSDVRTSSSETSRVEVQVFFHFNTLLTLTKCKNVWRHYGSNYLPLTQKNRRRRDSESFMDWSKSETFWGNVYYDYRIIIVRSLKLENLGTFVESLRAWCETLGYTALTPTLFLCCIGSVHLSVSSLRNPLAELGVIRSVSAGGSSRWPGLKSYFWHILSGHP